MEYDTPDGSHPIYYAFAHAYEAAVRAAIAAHFASERGQLDEEDREEWAELMLEYFVGLDQAWIKVLESKLEDVELSPGSRQDLLEEIQDLEEILNEEDARDWAEIFEEARDAEQVDHMLRRGFSLGGEDSS